LKVFPKKILIHKKRFWVLFLQKKHGSLIYLSKKKIHPTTEEVTFGKDLTHHIFVDKPSFEKGLNVFFFVEIHQGQLFFPFGRNPLLNPKIYNAIVKEKLVPQLTMGYQGKQKVKIGIMVFVALFGIAIGWIIRGLF
jgi:hypothetical protein